MQFNSLIFLFFSALFFISWTFTKTKNKPRWICLVVFSLFFYGWWDWRFLFLILFSGLIDYVAGWWMQRYPERKKGALWLSIGVNLGALSIFKYSSFIAESVDPFLVKIGLSYSLLENIPEFALILPVGISFYTFQSMSYTLDIYRGQLKPTQNIFHFFAYLTMFPQLVAGPIVRAKQLLKQLTKVRTISSLEMWHGTKLIVLGLFQKTVLADNLAPMINMSFRDIEKYPSMGHWWLVMFAFSFQIYFDFSGYSHIARGLAKWMGFHFRVNFNHPYLAFSLKNFWSRWHISLSTWFRDYVYLPLGGNSVGRFKAHLFMWVAMILSGIWHGAAYTFIIWGALHAVGLSVEREFVRRINSKLFNYLFAMLVVIVGWVFFRAVTFDDGVKIIQLLFMGSSEWLTYKYFTNSYIFLSAAVLIEVIYMLNKKYNFVVIMQKYWDIVQVAFMLTSVLFLRGKAVEFIYFQF